MTIEYRYVRKDAAPSADDKGKLSGRAAPFNVQTVIGGEKYGFRESIKPGAFKKSIAERDIVLLDNHNTSKPLARTSAGTLELRESSKGLDFDAEPARTTYAQDCVENARAGNYGGMSFGFEVIKDSWKRGENGALDERVLEEVRLHEISVVTFPAYGEGTKVSARDQVAAAEESRRRWLAEEARENGDEDLADELESEERDEDSDERGGNAPGNGKKPYGNVTYADPGYQKDKKKRYPIDTKEHAIAAWRYIAKAKNAGAYTASQLASIKARIKAALKKFGVKTAEANAVPMDQLCAFREMTEGWEAYVDPDELEEARENERQEAQMRTIEQNITADVRADLLEIFGDSELSDTRKVAAAIKRLAVSLRDVQHLTPVDPIEASDGDEQCSDASGTEPDKNGHKAVCNVCKGTKKDKSGNICYSCNGTGWANQTTGNADDGEEPTDIEDSASGGGDPGPRSQTDPDAEEREGGEPSDAHSRTDEDRKDALRRAKMRMLSRQS